MVGLNARVTGQRTLFCVDRSVSALLVEARSNVGLVSFGTTQIAGDIEAFEVGQSLDTRRECAARLVVPLASLSSGNALYDAELQKRLSARLFPDVVVELVEAAPLSPAEHHVSGRFTLHGVTAVLQGDVRITRPDLESILIRGESVIDIRDFGIPVPSVLMLRIYPDVKVSLQLVARRATKEP